MKRSDINAILAEGDVFFRSFGYVLPPFAHWTPAELKSRDHAHIAARGLGWDITDYGRGDFAKLGLFLFTTRNGDVADLSQGRGVLYAEKIMISRKHQLCPMHRHNLKTEDIINRGGGDLVLELFASASDGGIDRESEISVISDGRRRSIQPGGRLRLRPGESITLMPEVWHAFWGERGDVLVGEVSTTNDDQTDNRFEDPIGRFATVEEDEAPWRLLVSDYAAWL